MDKEAQIGVTPAMKGDESKEGRMEIKPQLTSIIPGTLITVLQTCGVCVGSKNFSAEAQMSLADHISLICLVAAVFLGGCFFVFLSYITMEYAKSWLEKLRMLPLLIAALIIPLLGALMIRKKLRIWKLVREAADVATVNCRFDRSVVGSTSDTKEASHMEINLLACSEDPGLI